MEWDRKHSGVSANTIRFVFMVVFAGIWLVVKIVFFSFRPSLRIAEEIAFGLFAIWALGAWTDKAEDDDRKVREAFDLLDEKLNTILKNQTEIHRMLCLITESTD